MVIRRSSAEATTKISGKGNSLATIPVKLRFISCAREAPNDSHPVQTDRGYATRRGIEIRGREEHALAIGRIHGRGGELTSAADQPERRWRRRSVSIPRGGGHRTHP